MDLRQSGMAHGVYMRNSNGMDVNYGDGFLSYRMIGGDALLLDYVEMFNMYVCMC